MAEYGPAVGGNKVFAIVVLDGRGLRFGIDPPCLGQPAAIQQICGRQKHSGDQYDYKGIHG